jgi:hypothetical protein
MVMSYKKKVACDLALPAAQQHKWILVVGESFVS